MSISVIIPTKNRKKQALTAIESVVNQSYSVNEIIVVDDGSDDKLKLDDMPEQGGKQITQILYNDSSKGANYCRNLGAVKAAGDILMFLDDDDTWEPNKVKSQLDVFANKPDCGLVYTGKLFVSSGNRNHILRKVTPKKRGDLKREIFKNNWIGSTSGVAVRKDIFHESGKFDETLPSFQDYDLYIRICQLTRIEHDRSCHLRYTVHNTHENQISGQINRHLESISILRSKYSDLLDSRRKRLFHGFLWYNIGKAYLKTEPKKSIGPLFKSIFSINRLKALYLLSIAMAKVIVQPGRKHEGK